MDLYDDAALYDAQYASYREDLAFYRGLALDQSGPILEIGAGTGRVTTELARLGEVVALEPAAAMRARAAARLERERLAERVTLLDADARVYRPDRGFALAVAPFNALMHLLTLPDQDAVLRMVAGALLPGGAFACDVYVPRFGPMGVLRREAAWEAAGGAHTDLWLLQRHHEAAQRIESQYLLDETGPDGALRRRRVRLTQRYYHRYELERAVRAAGFSNVRVFGDFDRAPVSEDAERYVVIARP